MEEVLTFIESLSIKFHYGYLLVVVESELGQPEVLEERHNSCDECRITSSQIQRSVSKWNMTEVVIVNHGSICVTEGILRNGDSVKLNNELTLQFDCLLPTCLQRHFLFVVH